MYTDHVFPLHIVVLYDQWRSWILMKNVRKETDVKAKQALSMIKFGHLGTTC